MHLARLACVGAATLLAVGSRSPVGAAGAAQQQPTFRSTTALVEVDVSVHDGQGRFIPGLLADDLRIFEDGKEQKIQQFYMVSHDPTKASRAGAYGAGLSRDEAVERARRFFVFMFDEGHLAPESLMRAKKGVEGFLRRQMLPGDMAGVFANGVMNKSRMTDDTIELVAAARNATPVPDHRQALLAPFREFPRIPSEHDAVRITDGNLELVDQLGRKACAEDPFQCQLQGGLNQVENQIQLKARLYVRSARVLTDTTIQNLQYVTANLSRLIGRKTVVLITEGFFSEETRSQLESLAAQAARGGTTIYTVDGRGLVNTMSANPDVTMASMARSVALDTGDDGLNILTSGTGGLMYHGIDDIARAIGMLANDTSSYYVIGYAPENAQMDGKFRSIEVKAAPTARDLHIRARKGYAAVNLPPQEFVKR